MKRNKDYKRCKDIVEFTKEVREIKDIQQRNVERAVIGEGPYCLRKNYAEGPYCLRKNYAEELEVDPEVWFHQMTPLQRQQHLDKLMSTEVKLPESQLQEEAGAGPKPTKSRPKSTDAICHLSMSFEESGLSSLVHA